MDQSFDLISLGEFMVELRRSTSDSRRFDAQLAGDSLNAAVAAAYDGLRVLYRSAIARDIHFSFIQEALGGLPLAFQLVEKSDGFNGLYFVANDKTGERRFQYYRAGSAASLYPTLSGQKDIPARSLFLSGISQALSLEWQNLVQELMQQASAQGILGVYDINFRPKLWSQDRAVAALQKLLPYIKVLFVSQDDFPVLAAALDIKHGTDAELLALAAEAGPDLVVLRKGAAGCSWYHKTLGQVEERPAPVVEALDTSGAGDVFAGVFLASFLRENNAAVAAERALQVAAKHTQRLGALPVAALYLP